MADLPDNIGAQSCAQICKSDLDLVNTNLKVADLEKFKDKQKWLEWEKVFVDYLSLIPGMNRVLLAYEVCEYVELDDVAEYLSFNEWVIARAPDEGQYYMLVDSCHVHNLLITSYM